MKSPFLFSQSAGCLTAESTGVQPGASTKFNYSSTSRSSSPTKLIQLKMREFSLLGYKNHTPINFIYTILAILSSRKNNAFKANYAKKHKKTPIFKCLPITVSICVKELYKYSHKKFEKVNVLSLSRFTYIFV
jgi:hypothetical protein